MILDEKQCRLQTVKEVAGHMMAAARTAPKGKGNDRLEIVTVTGDDLHRIAEYMRGQCEAHGMKFFLRDALNVEQADAVVFIGTRLGTFGLNCGFCGFGTCAEKNEFEKVPCAFNINDLGIAVGSAASVAMDHRIDSRIMYSAASAALELGMLGDCKAAFGILLSCAGKNPFFDRKSTRPEEK